MNNDKLKTGTDITLYKWELGNDNDGRTFCCIIIKMINQKFRNDSEQGNQFLHIHFK